MLERTKTKTLRCAIYTRKSSEEGLEQDFNSLHAQREACEAFVVSQKHEGWKTLPATYDDGGYSGGSMERPGLQQLLADIRSRLVNVVVVYKVDRLTRSLTDFAKIVEVFDLQGVSFVSVTQQFNTTSSMGRLTLNVLLSFAQFEREVTGERIRDKIAASKKKGLWMGGWVPIGYDAKERTLVVNEAEAGTVRTIFQLYRECKNVRLVHAELNHLKLTTKCYVASTGRAIGGLPFSRGHIYKILSNSLYIGEIEHKGARHPGQHPPIIDRQTWDDVQAQLQANGTENRLRSNTRNPSLLAGLLFDATGQKLTATHAVKNGKRYRYYTSPVAAKRSGRTNTDARLSIAAVEIESAVIEQLVSSLNDPHWLIRLVGSEDSTPTALDRLVAKASRLAADLASKGQIERRRLISEISHRIIVDASTLRIEVARPGLLHMLGHILQAACTEGDDSAAIEAPCRLARHTNDAKSLIVNGLSEEPRRCIQPALIKAIARGHVWFEDLVHGRARSMRSIAEVEGVTERYIGQLLEMAFISPAIVDQILDGRQLPRVAVRDLMKFAAPGAGKPALAADQP